MNIVPGRNILVHQVTSESHDPSSPPTFLSVFLKVKHLLATKQVNTFSLKIIICKLSLVINDIKMSILKLCIYLFGRHFYLKQVK